MKTLFEAVFDASVALGYAWKVANLEGSPTTVLYFKSDRDRVKFRYSLLASVPEGYLICGTWGADRNEFQLNGAKFILSYPIRPRPWIFEYQPEPPYGGYYILAPPAPPWYAGTVGVRSCLNLSSV